MKENIEYVHEYDDFPQDGHADYYGMEENRSKKNKYGQMHLHTPASDGLIIPQDIINAGLDFVCITDHDSMDNFDKYRKELEPSGIRVVPGVEITTTHFGKDIHVLLYDPKRIDIEFFDKMKDTRRRRIERALEIARKLRSEGFLIDDGFMLKANGAIAKGNIAYEVLKEDENKPLLEKQGLKTTHDFIRAYLNDGKPAYVPMQRIPLEEYLKGVNAVKVLAHPAKDLVPWDDDYIIEDLVRNKRYRFTGIETTTQDGRGNELVNTHYQHLATILDLVGTRSNDCHVKEDLYHRKESEETLDELLAHERFDVY